MNIPNFLTLLRMLMVPAVVVAILQGEFALAFWGFVVAGITDGIDGFIARRFDMRTTLGAYLDPLADKALIVSIYVTLAATGMIPRWLTILVVARDVMIIGAVILSWVLAHPVKIKPLFVSKANTAAQIICASLILASLGLPVPGLARFVDLAIWAVAGLTVTSMAAYLWSWMRHMAGLEEA